MTIKKYELLRINDLLVKSINYKSHEFAYAIFKNKQLIDEILKDVEFINDVDEKFMEYENKRIELCRICAKKDPDGKEIVQEGRFAIQDNDTFTKGMDELRAEYKEVVDKRDEQLNRFNLIMQEDVDLDFVKVEKKDLPTEIQTANEMFEYGFMIQ